MAKKKTKKELDSIYSVKIRDVNHLIALKDYKTSVCIKRSCDYTIMPVAVLINWQLGHIVTLIKSGALYCKYL